MGLKYYANINDTTLSDLLRQGNIKTENPFIDFSDYSWQDSPDTGRIKGAYIIFYQGGTIDHEIHVTETVLQSSAESEYNSACTAGMDLVHFRMLIHELLSKDPDIVPEEVLPIILDSKSAVCISNTGKDTKHTRQIARRIYLVRNGEKCKMHNIDWCEGGLHLAEISTKNVGDNDLNIKMKYIMVRLYN